MGLGNRENVADIAIVDPAMAAGMPPQLTADTGLDALTHAVEGYTCTWHTDLSDGLCVEAARLVFENLPRAVVDGSDMQARERMHNAATCAGLGFGNAMAAIAHSMGHVLGAVFHVPHGRAVGLCLPYTVEFAARTAPERFAELAAALGISQAGGKEGARALAKRVRDLSREIGSPTCISEMGITHQAYEAKLEKLVDDAFNDTQVVAAARMPSFEEMERLFVCAYDGDPVEF
jgi:alcohol dehydrogenase class IV